MPALATLLRRPRRLRAHPGLRALVRQTALSPDDFVMPYFVRPGRNRRREISSMPGQYQWTRDLLVREARELFARGVRATILFGLPARKDAAGSEAASARGAVPEAVRALKDALPDLTVVTDVCLCAYTDHGHCGILARRGPRVQIDNDATLPILGRVAVSHARAGADVVAPSGMMDGAVGAIRRALDAAGFADRAILAYAAKYASSFYGPFREAAQSAPKFGDRTSYQMDPANADEALREIELDLAEGADLVMVKPALAYLDVIRRARERFPVPLAAYSVSGEYSLVKAAAARGWADERAVALEILTAIRRAGADFVLTYWAKEAAAWIR